jgi:hypothetical protein
MTGMLPFSSYQILLFTLKLAIEKSWQNYIRRKLLTITESSKK